MMPLKYKEGKQVWYGSMKNTFEKYEESVF